MGTKSEFQGFTQKGFANAVVLIVADMLLALLSVCSEEELSEPASEPGNSAEDIQRRREEIKRKIRAVGKMQRVYQILRLVPFPSRLDAWFMTVLVCSH